jgi:hypothetical protein
LQPETALGDPWFPLIALRSVSVIDVRPFDGSADELSAFVCRVWREAYAGRMAFPLWTPEYLNWQLDLRGPGREFALAAYDGSRLAGALLGCRYDFQTPEGIVGGLLSSWLSVDAPDRGRGLVAALKEEQARRVRAAGGRLIMAYRYLGSRHSLSTPPTPDDFESGEWSVRNVGFWVCLLDPRRAAGWYVDRAQRFLTNVVAPFVRAPKEPDSTETIRRYEAGDLNPCVELLSREADRLGFAIRWNAERLATHCGGFGECVVAEVDGMLKGLVTFHVLPFQGRTVEPVGVIDLVAVDELPPSGQRSLLRAALRRMQERGAVLALKLRLGDVPAGTLVRSGFVPWVRDSLETIRRLDDGPTLPLHRSQSVLWR